jgi:hypothetical protein
MNEQTLANDRLDSVENVNLIRCDTKCSPNVLNSQNDYLAGFRSELTSPATTTTTTTTISSNETFLQLPTVTIGKQQAVSDRILPYESPLSKLILGIDKTASRSPNSLFSHLERNRMTNHSNKRGITAAFAQTTHSIGKNKNNDIHKHDIHSNSTNQPTKRQRLAPVDVNSNDNVQCSGRIRHQRRNSFVMILPTAEFLEELQGSIEDD